MFIYVTESMFCVNRTTSVPKSLLSYYLDKEGSYLGLVFCTQSCFPNTYNTLWIILKILAPRVTICHFLFVAT